MSIRCVLWDFGDTLVDERIMWPVPKGVPEWTAAWLALADTDVLDRWCLGELALGEVAEGMAAGLPMSTEQVIEHMRLRCRNVVPHPHAMAFAATCKLSQAIVTVNPDIFTTDIVPAMKLGDRFDRIVTSWEERTLDKPALCEIALQRLGFRCERSEALLIDNKPENVHAWRKVGGAGYVFESDLRFRNDAAKGRVTASPA